MNIRITYLLLFPFPQLEEEERKPTYLLLYNQNECEYFWLLPLFRKCETCFICATCTCSSWYKNIFGKYMNYKSICFLGQFQLIKVSVTIQVTKHKSYVATLS